MAFHEQYDDLMYEEDHRGQRLVRSIKSDQCVYIRFINRVSRPVDVWWRDFRGRRRHYARMEPHSYFNVDTFLTHPWEFRDAGTTENYVINNHPIFRAPRSLAGVSHRTNWIISVPVRTLRNTAMLAVAEYFPDPNKVPALGLPKNLSEDLAKRIISVQNVPPLPVQAL